MNNIYLNIGGWSITDITEQGQSLSFRTSNLGGLDISKLLVGGNATVGGDVTATKFCFQGSTTCLTSQTSQAGVTSLESTDSYINVSSITGDAKLSLGINPLVTYLKTIFQIQATPADPDNNNYICPAGQALVEINAGGSFFCEPIGGGGGGTVGPGTIGTLSKFKTVDTLGDSVIIERNGNIGIGVADPQARVDVKGIVPLIGSGAIGIQGISVSNISGLSGVYGEELSADVGSYGVFGKSHSQSGSGVRGTSDGEGGSGGSFNYSRTDVRGYALKTESGPVFLGGNVGIGSDPNALSWPTVGATAEKLKVLIGGSVGAKSYCDENGLNCLTLSIKPTNYWKYDPITKAIYNKNPDNTGVGVVGIGRQPLINPLYKLDVFTNGGKKRAILGESDAIGGIGILGLTNGDRAIGVKGEAFGGFGVGGYFSAEGDALTSGGFALQTGEGLVQFGDESIRGIVGIGTPPANWTTSASRSSLQLLTQGNVGASAYCQEDGTGCFAPAATGEDYWSANTKGDIYSSKSPIGCTDTLIPEGGVWKKETPSNYPQNRGTQVVTFNNKLWMLGGAYGTGNQVWSSVDGISWTLTGSAPWPGRLQHASVVFKDPLDGVSKIWIMGGTNNVSYFNDIWSSVDGTNWINRGNATWSPRSPESAVVYNDKIWIMGGFYGADLLSTGEVWSSLDGISWTRGSDMTGLSRKGHATVVYKGKIFLIGGFHRASLSSQSYINDIRSFDGANWALERVPVEQISDASATVFGGRLFISGFQFGSSAVPHYWWTSDGHTLSKDPDKDSLGGTLNIPDYGPTIVFQNKLWLLGQTELWSYDSGTSGALSGVTTQFGPSLTTSNMRVPFGTRYGHSVFTKDNKIFILTGRDTSETSSVSYSTAKNDIWSSYNGVAWNKVIPKTGLVAPYYPTFPKRSQQTVLVVGSRIWVFGGIITECGPGTCSMNGFDIWYSDDDGQSWQKDTSLTKSNFWGGPQVNLSAVYFNGAIYLFQGSNPLYPSVGFRRETYNEIFYRGADATTGASSGPWSRLTFTYHGYSGYGPEDVYDNNGTEDLNPKIVVFDNKIWSLMRYSGGGFQAVNLSNSDVTGLSILVPNNSPNTEIIGYPDIPIYNNFTIDRVFVHNNRVWLSATSNGNTDFWSTANFLTWKKELGLIKENLNSPIVSLDNKIRFIGNDSGVIGSMENSSGEQAKILTSSQGGNSINCYTTGGSPEGKVGIGTQTPRGKLDLKGSLWPGQICLRHSAKFGDVAGSWECAGSWQEFRYIITSSPSGG